MCTFEDAVTLNQVHAFEGNVEARVIGVFQQHELTAVSTGLDLAKPFELADAVINMDNVVAGLQLGKIAEETGSANFAAGTFDCGGDVEKIGMTEEREARVWKGDAFGEGGANEQHGRGFGCALGKEPGSGGF